MVNETKLSLVESLTIDGTPVTLLGYQKVSNCDIYITAGVLKDVKLYFVNRDFNDVRMCIEVEADIGIGEAYIADVSMEEF